MRRLPAPDRLRLLGQLADRTRNRRRPGPRSRSRNGALSLRAIDIPVGGRLTIVNSDSIAHDMGSDPHPSHEDCTELNLIGMLEPGRSRTSGNLVEARTCGMHDHLRPLDTALHLRITIR